MRLSTIWSIPAMTMAERMRRTRDWGFQEVAARLPVRLKYFVTMQALARATSKLPNANVPAIPLDDILKNLDEPKRGIS